MIFLNNSDDFPDVSLANTDGILAIGADLSPKRLLLAYKNGIFPWFNQGEPIVWHAPKYRMVLFPDELKISKSMRKVLQKQLFYITFNQNFEQVIYHCKNIERNDQNGTWITDEMQEAYIKLHKLGVAKSVEVWQNNKLVGGLYGIDLGHVFCGESMFSLVSNASKVAFIYLTKMLARQNYKLIDCQIYNSHLASLGAREISRDVFMKYLKNKK